MMKAYKVSSEHSEAAVIVFAEDESKAKSIGIKSEWLCDEDYIDLRASRMKKLDSQSIGSEELLDGSTHRSQLLMWLSGWHPIEGSGTTCEECENYEWDMVNESKCSEVNGFLICKCCQSSSTEWKKEDQQNQTIRLMSKKGDQ